LGGRRKGRRKGRVGSWGKDNEGHIEKKNNKGKKIKGTSGWDKKTEKPGSAISSKGQKGKEADY